MIHMQLVYRDVDVPWESPTQSRLLASLSWHLLALTAYQVFDSTLSTSGRSKMVALPKTTKSSCHNTRRNLE